MYIFIIYDVHTFDMARVIKSCIYYILFITYVYYIVM
jgi:hypothetical protein